MFSILHVVRRLKAHRAVARCLPSVPTRPENINKTYNTSLRLWTLDHDLHALRNRLRDLSCFADLGPVRMTTWADALSTPRNVARPLNRKLRHQRCPPRPCFSFQIWVVLAVHTLECFSYMLGCGRSTIQHTVETGISRYERGGKSGSFIKSVKPCFVHDIAVGGF